MSEKPPVRTRIRPFSQAPQKPNRLPNGQWPKGVCGNTNGRPRKSADQRSVEDRVLQALVVVSRDGRREKITTEQAVLEVVVAGALQRDPAMVRIAARHIFRRIYSRAAQGEQAAQSAVDHVVHEEPLTEAELELYDRILQRAKKEQEDGS